MAAGPKQTGLWLPMRVWDAPTRLFHWTLMVGVVTCYVSVKLNAMTLHMISGETVLALLLFRLVWGVIGSDTARFAHFIRNPLHGLTHLASFTRKGPDTQVGHNEAGGWMVVAMLALLLTQAATGLFANDADSFIAGPLAKLISEDAGLSALHLHDLNFNFVKIVVLLHIAAIIAYAVVRKHNLVPPMITGKKRLPAATRAPRMVSPVLGGVVFAVCGALVWALVTQL